MSRTTVRLLFAIVGAYDVVIGLAFLFFGAALFTWADVPHPNHWGYIQFGALLLLIFGAMFFAVARDPVGNRNLIPYGIALKVCYAGIVGYYWLTTGCPTLFKPFAVIDAVTVALFWTAYRGRADSAAG